VSLVLGRTDVFSPGHGVKTPQGAAELAIAIGTPVAECYLGVTTFRLVFFVYFASAARGLLSVPVSFRLGILFWAPHTVRHGTSNINHGAVRWDRIGGATKVHQVI